MTVSPRNYDESGNHIQADGVQFTYDTMTNLPVPVATQPSIYTGTGTPTFSAVKGSLYLNLTGSSTATRLFINNGTTAWVAVTTAS